jgi:acetyl esterase/lipase
MSEAGGRVELVTYQGVGHVGIVASLAVPLPETAPVATDIGDFLNRHL